MASSRFGSALDRIEQQFHALTTHAARPLAVDGAEIGHGLSDRPIPLNELRDLLLARDATDDLKDAAWSALVRHAQADSDPWGVGAGRRHDARPAAHRPVG